MATEERKDRDETVKRDDQQPEVKDLASKKLEREEEERVKGGWDTGRNELDAL